MTDPNDPIMEPQEDDEDVSWEDAFAEAAAGQGTEAVHEAAPQSMPEDTGSVGTQALDSHGDLDQGAIDIDFLLDISLDVTVEVGRTKMLINEMLQLQQGSVIDLDKMVGEPFEVYVNGKLMAYGEVVVVNEKFGIRLTDIIDPRERLQQLA